MTLTDFLLARVAEDEAEVRAHGSTAVGHRSACIFEGGYEGTLDCDCGGVERVLAECAAKRAIIENMAPDIGAPYCLGHDARHLIEECPVLRVLAGVHVGHPDYRDEWRP